MIRRFKALSFTWLLCVAGLVVGVLGTVPGVALANGHGHHRGGGFGGGHHGFGVGYGGGHFVHRANAHYYPRVHSGFYGNHGHFNSWNGYRGYGFGYRPAWGYGGVYRGHYGFGFGVGYGSPYRTWYRGPRYGWNSCFSYPAYGYGWNWPTCYSGNAFYLYGGSVVPRLRVRVLNRWGIPFVNADAAPGLDVDGDGLVDPVRLAARGPVPMPPDEPLPAARDLVYPIVRETSAGARRRAESYVDLGDKLFGKGQHHAALAQYKLAATAASDWGTPYYRQAFASIAVRRYDEASSLMRRAVRLDPRFVRSDFRLDRLYGERATSKHEHQEALAAAAIERPDQAELVYLVGVLLHFDGEGERAQKFFAHAVHLRGDSTNMEIAAFLPGPIAELASRDLDL